MTDLERGNAEAVRLTNEEERKSDNEQTCYTKEELEGTLFYWNFSVFTNNFYNQFWN